VYQELEIIERDLTFMKQIDSLNSPNAFDLNVIGYWFCWRPGLYISMLFPHFFLLNSNIT